jgi:hypothetical protein
MGDAVRISASSLKLTHTLQITCDRRHGWTTGSSGRAVTPGAMNQRRPETLRVQGPASSFARSWVCPYTTPAPASRLGPFFAPMPCGRAGLPKSTSARSRRFTCPERTSGTPDEPFCCAVPVRPQQGTTLGRDSRLRWADDDQQQARSQART